MSNIPARPTLFLDIDGVMNRYGHDQLACAFHPDAVAALRQIAHAMPTLQLVISSAWRKLFRDLEAWRMLFQSHGVCLNVVACTQTGVPSGIPTTYSSRSASCARGDEIAYWLSQHPQVTSYAVVDDDPDAGIGHGHRFVMTDSCVGLTSANVAVITSLLGDATPHAVKAVSCQEVS